MTELHPLLRQIFSQAKSDPSSASSQLEEQVLAAWRYEQIASFSTPSNMLPALRWGLGCACLVLTLACLLAWPFLKSPADATVMITNSAFLTGLSHENR